MNLPILVGDCRTVLATFAEQTFNCCVTSPPYWKLRNYGVDGQLGLEKSPEEYVSNLVSVFREVRRVLRNDGTLWLVLGDCYAASGRGGDTGKSGLEGSVDSQDQSKIAMTGGPRIGNRSSFRRDRAPRQDVPHKGSPSLKPKDLVGIPWRVAFGLQADGWYLRSDIIWSKTNPIPESVRDRPTKSHEYVFLLSKTRRYYYDADAIAEPCLTREQRWDPGTNGLAGVHRKTGRSTRRYRSGNKVRRLADGSSGQRPADHLGSGIPWQDVSGIKNKRSVWRLSTEPYAGDHYATFPTKLVEPCVLAGSPRGGGSARSLRGKRDNWRRGSRARSLFRRHRAKSEVRRGGTREDRVVHAPARGA